MENWAGSKPRRLSLDGQLEYTTTTGWIKAKREHHTTLDPRKREGFATFNVNRAQLPSVS